jgi:hypothetical protein
MSRSEEHLHPEGAPQLPETPVSLSYDSNSQLDNMELKAPTTFRVVFVSPVRVSAKPARHRSS